MVNKRDMRILTGFNSLSMKTSGQFEQLGNHPLLMKNPAVRTKFAAIFQCLFMYPILYQAVSIARVTINDTFGGKQSEKS
jgi:hypothetical protein